MKRKGLQKKRPNLETKREHRKKLIAVREEEENAREKSLLRKRKLAILEKLSVNKKAKK